ncbi:MAG TPA: hypothetical protein VK911_03040 [Vicinamibacterales bacterium]|nr:hypothetical protein [Vicinamibacterales bacterium]
MLKVLVPKAPGVLEVRVLEVRVLKVPEVPGVLEVRVLKVPASARY